MRPDVVGCDQEARDDTEWVLEVGKDAVLSSDDDEFDLEPEEEFQDSDEEDYRADLEANRDPQDRLSEQVPPH